MIAIVLLGAGNVATHLANACLTHPKIHLSQIYSRSKKSLEKFTNKTQTTTSLHNLVKADVYIIAIPDNRVADFSEKLDLPKNALVVHTSGSIAMKALSSKYHRGVFYPLQTFSINKEVDFAMIPICIEAEHAKDLTVLNTLAKAISDNVYAISSKQRKSIHVAAVFVNNFTNHLYYLAHEICDTHKVPFNILTPLIEETAKKVQELTPLKAQTGPARRNDTKTIKAHLKMLTEKQQEIYTLLTDSIKDTYGKEL